MSDELPPAAAEFLARTNCTPHSEAWAQISGYVAEMVREGSSDAAAILTYMHEVKPGTRLFTGSVEQLKREGTE